MTNNRNLSLLENLPDELLYHKSKDGIGRYLTFRDLSVLTRTSSRLNTLFQPELSLIRFKVTQLSKYIIKARYSEAEEIVKATPSLMFFPLPDHPEKISSLKITCKVNDSLMQQIFHSVIQDTQDPKLLERFKKQLNEPVNKIDLEPLLGEQGAYKHYADQYDLWEKNKISVEQLDVQWKSLGAAQAKYLPWWMLRLICDEQISWRKHSFFKANYARQKRSCMIKAYYNDKHGDMEFLDLAKLGIDYTLVNGGDAAMPAGIPGRSGGGCLAQMGWQCGRNRVAIWARRDLAIFRLLWKVNVENYENRKQSLNVVCNQPG